MYDLTCLHTILPGFAWRYGARPIRLSARVRQPDCRHQFMRRGARRGRRARGILGDHKRDLIYVTRCPPGPHCASGAGAARRVNNLLIVVIPALNRAANRSTAAASSRRAARARRRHRPRWEGQKRPSFWKTINRLTRRAAPAPEARGGAKLNIRSICDRPSDGSRDAAPARHAGQTQAHIWVTRTLSGCCRLMLRFSHTTHQGSQCLMCCI